MEGPSASALIVHGTALDHLRSMPDDSVDSVVCDPPYGLSNTDPKHVTEAITHWATGDREFVPAGRGFMSALWDSFVPPPALWDECLRVLKPGGHLAAFAGSRTHDLMTLSIRMAGFEIRDSLAWIYGSGMPHGQDVGKALSKQGHPDARVWTGWNTALKPGHEPVVLARRPLAEGSVGRSVLTYGTGALNIDATRIPHRSAADLAESTGKNRHADFGTPPGGNSVYGDFSMVPSKNYDGSAGRHPANVLLTHGEYCGESACAPGCPVSRIDEQAPGPKGTGGASRFFYTGRATASERPSYIASDGAKVQHVSVKPLGLMRWLVRLLTPPGGTVLDPFAGSGTTAEAALLEGFDSVVIEREAEYIPLIEQRVARAGQGAAGAATGRAA